MDQERNQRRFESVFSRKVRAGKRRTYFFDVRRTKGDDYYLTLTESTRKFNGDGYERHKIFLYKEDFNRFLANLDEVIEHIKTELMPEYDYDEYTRRHEEYEARMIEEAAAGFDPNANPNATVEAENAPANASVEASNDPVEEVKKVEETVSIETEDDMSW